MKVCVVLAGGKAVPASGRVGFGFVVHPRVGDLF